MTVLQEQIARELSAGERMLWSGQPRQGVVLRGSDALLIPFSLMWCGFAIFWEWSVIGAPEAPAFFVLWGVPFVAVGLYVVVGRFFGEAWQRARTFYAVTDERVLIVSGVFSRKVKSLSLRTLADLSVTERRNGVGSVTFGGGSPFGAMFGGLSGWPGAGAHQGPRFDLIPQAKAVFEIIRTAQRSAS